MSDTISFLAAQLADCETLWSLGTFGALAEFVRDAGEPVNLATEERALSAVTARGGIRITPPTEMRLFASEGVTRESWSQRVALCLPGRQCGMSRRRVLTELGPDSAALREDDRGAILFDLGLDAVQVDACIRVRDAQLASELRACAGRPVFDHDNPAMRIILAVSPPRVFASRLGRIEVFAPIPPPNGTSPEGPHTHVLPKLLARRRTHSATEPVPAGYVPCAHLYPAHPMRDSLGRARAYDAGRHERFQEMLGRLGDPDAVKLKERVIAAVRQGRDPARWRAPKDRFARAGIRVALRQMRAANAASPALAAWIALYDRVNPASSDRDDELHGESNHAPA